MIVKFAMDQEQRKRADVLVQANLVVFYEDKEGNLFTSDKIADFMRDCDIKLEIIDKIDSERIGIFHRLDLADYVDCMQFGEDALRALAIANHFDVVVHVEENAILRIADSLEALGKRFFYFGASMKYIWCGFNSAVDGEELIRDFLIKVYPLYGEEMFNSRFK